MLDTSGACLRYSKAREIPAGPYAPKPLRSNDSPEGLESLTGVDYLRVQAANALYCRACKIFKRCSELGKVVTLENPSNSYFWITVWWLQVQQNLQTFATDFQVCMYGGSRPKWTKIAANFEAIKNLDIACDHSHQHAAWGKTFDSEGKQVWATSTEAQYPRKMCVALTTCVIQLLQELGVEMPPTSLSDNSAASSSQTSRVATHLQPSRKRLPPFVPEYSGIQVIQVQQLSQVPCTLLQKLSNDWHFSHSVIPKASRFLRFKAIQNVGEEGDCFEVVFGLPWRFEDFLQKAITTGHPVQAMRCLPKDLTEVVNIHKTWSYADISSHRLSWCKKWLRRASELEPEEKLDHGKRDEHVKLTTAKKRLLLFEEILHDIGYEDLQVVDILRTGATLVGDIPSIPVFDDCYKPGLATVAQLEENASKRNEAVLRMTKSSGDIQTDRTVQEETLLEVDRGWADGPHNVKELPRGAVISHRFPLPQQSKVRMIDDYTVSGVNDTATVHSKVDLHMVDTFCNLTKNLLASKSDVDPQRLLAKTYDLKSAYRQVPIRSDHLKYSFFSVFDPEKNRPAVYRLKTLPFGAVHSVYCFLRLAKAIHAIATRALFLITTNFYDDYILASPAELTESSKHSMEMIFLLLGWDYAKDGKKSTEFGETCDALGVCFDLSLSSERKMRVFNTESRRASLLEQLSQATQRGSVTRHDAMSLRGRLQFADSCLHGRAGSLALKRLAEHAYGHSSKLSDELVASLTLMRGRLEVNRPRDINPDPEKVWYVFSDASYEPESATGGVGAVLYNQSGELEAWFGSQLDALICKRFGAGEKETIIYELEFLAVVIAAKLWDSFLTEQLQVFFCDNEGVRYSLIRGAASGCVGEHLLKLFLEKESEKNYYPWFARVASETNIADFPSRGIRIDALQISSEVDQKVFNSCLSEILRPL